ncbi:MAG: hypothetical protein D6695_04900 [Planctomycetota bacterium]|nr:MAG: hypothetical protein D6695_04900 [Planctomycetota bacterium]
MTNRFEQLPRFLAERARLKTLGPAPVLLAHPDWESPAPVVFWMHGRTASKELDPGRYTRWLRAGIAACAIDLPAHGQRRDGRSDDPDQSMDLLAEAVGEIDLIVTALGQEEGVLFDPDRAAIGGMSLGGMVALRRLCDPHPFACAAVEATCGSLTELYFPSDGRDAPWKVAHDPDQVASLDPAAHLDGWRPLPILALHCEADEIIPWKAQRHFLDLLRQHYRSLGADEQLIEVKTFPQTGAKFEHIGFGRFSNDAKNAQTEFLARHLMR